MIQIYYNNTWNDWERAYLQGEIVEITLPDMTSNSQSGYVASASTYWSGYEPYKAFSPSGYWCTSQGNYSGWIQLTMPKLYNITSISYNILSETVGGTCTIESSEDGVLWNTIVNTFTITNATKTINFSKSIKCKYIKFNIAASSTTLLAGVNRIQIFGYND